MPSKKTTKNKIAQIVPIIRVPKITAPKIKVAGFFKGGFWALVVIFLVLWIFIGLFLLLVILDNIQQGALARFFGSQKPQTVQQQTQEPQTPKEVDLPNIGKVNVACVQKAVSQESLQKVLEAQDSSVLKGDEKTQFEACIIEKPPQNP